MEKKTKVRLLALQIGSVIADRDSNIKKVKELLESMIIPIGGDVGERTASV